MEKFSFHLQARYGTRNGGASAEVAASYKARIGTTARRKDLVAVVSGNMPMWGYATGTPLEKAAGMDFWKAADRFERANGRLFLDHEVSLPSFFSLTQQKNLLDDFLKIITRVESGFLPYTFAIHGPAGKKRKNIHAHIQYSEKAYDGHERNPELWFKRAANGGGPDGGAPKADEPKRKVWLEHVRETWARVCNEHLERFGSDIRIDHRSYQDRGIDLMPMQHVGPKKRGGYSPEQLEIISSNSEIRKANAELIRLAGEKKLVNEEIIEFMREQQECEQAEAAMRAAENQGSRRPTFGKRRVANQGTETMEPVKTQQEETGVAKGPESGNKGGEKYEVKPQPKSKGPLPGGAKMDRTAGEFVVRRNFDNSHLPGGVRTSSRETGSAGTGGKIETGEKYGT